MNTAAYLKSTTLLVTSLVFGCTTYAPQDAVVQLSNSSFKLDIEKRGGQLINLQSTSSTLNPLSWRKTPDTMPRGSHKDAVYKGHFLCMGRIGKPSKGEQVAGVPMRGEQTGLPWTIRKQSTTSVVMECAAPLDNLKVSRKISLGTTDPYFLVTEQFTNSGTLGRFNNILQHATIGEPFLSEKTLINSNAKQGFNTKFAGPNPLEYEYSFPTAHLDKDGRTTTDLRLTSDPVSYLSHHIFDQADKYGWVTAYDPQSGIVLGYVWKLNDYPWLNIWNLSKGGKPKAKGLEFGTTGYLKSYRDLLRGDTNFHGVSPCEYIDSGETIEKSYLCFLINIGKDKPNPAVSFDEEHILLNGKSDIPNLLVSR